MRKFTASLLTLLLPAISMAAAAPIESQQAPKEKEWTLLVFLNGHNNLDPFGKSDINEMEKIGSTKDMNVVVQWASLANGNTKRMFVTKDNDSSKVNSVVVEEMPPVDMGDYRSLVEFIEWGARNYPAKKYFIDVWNHGSGWHMQQQLKRGNVAIQDISSDDLTGNIITTEQLGQAMTDASAAIGKKFEVYGSDACLMGMAEVAAEMSDSIKVFIGSQELEPGDGWHYDRLLAEWSANPRIDGKGVGRILTETYVNGYKNEDGITMSAVNVEQLGLLENALRVLGTAIRTLPKSDRDSIVKIAAQSQSFYYSDYVDAGDFVRRLAGARIQGVDSGILANLGAALQAYTVANGTSSSHADATGVSIWIPSSNYSYQQYASRYSGLKFSQRTGWGETIASLFE